MLDIQVNHCQRAQCTHTNCPASDMLHIYTSAARAHHPMKDLIRTIFSIRQQRRTPAAGPIPPLGTFIVRKEIRMAVNQPIPHDLWNWMVLSDWRTVPVKKDRRKTLELPAGALQELISAPPTERDTVHARILTRARVSRA